MRFLVRNVYFILTILIEWFCMIISLLVITITYYFT